MRDPGQVRFFREGVLFYPDGIVQEDPLTEEIIRKKKIAVLCGGASGEREVSLKSGAAVFDALREEGIKAVLMDVGELDLGRKFSRSGAEIAFIALHGGFGEDGTCQSVLEDMGIPFTGSGSSASRLAFDKVESKRIFTANGIPAPLSRVIGPGDERYLKNIDIPCVVKPVAQGSSIGLSLVSSEKDLGEAVRKALEYDRRVMLERYIPGREVTVGILGREILPAVEIISENGIYDYHAKYTSPGTRYVIPEDDESPEMTEIKKIALKAHDLIGCRGFSRVDMRISENMRSYVLEINTIPGLTRRSLLPMAARAGGLDFSNLCVKMLTESLTAACA